MSLIQFIFCIDSFIMNAFNTTYYKKISNIMMLRLLTNYNRLLPGYFHCYLGIQHQTPAEKQAVSWFIMSIGQCWARDSPVDWYSVNRCDRHGSLGTYLWITWDPFATSRGQSGALWCSYDSDGFAKSPPSNQLTLKAGAFKSRLISQSRGNSGKAGGKLLEFIGTN